MFAGHTGVRQERGGHGQRAPAESARAPVSAMPSRRRLHHHPAGPAALHGQGRPAHRQAGAGHRDDDGPQETGRRPVDARPHHRIPGRPVAARVHLPTREPCIILHMYSVFREKDRHHTHGDIYVKSQPS